MFGLIKKIFIKEPQAPSSTAPVSRGAPAYTRTALPGQKGKSANPFSDLPPGESAAEAAPNTAKTARPTAPALDPAPAVPQSAGPTPSVTTPDTAPTTVVPDSATDGLPNSVSLPLAEVVEKLPETLRRTFRSNLNSTMISLPLATILPQLSRGRIRLPFGLIRQFSPEGACSAGEDTDSQEIELPLQKVLARINPAQLPRRRQTPLMEVPTDVTGLFGSIGEPISSPTAVNRAPAPVAPPKPAAPEPSVETPVPPKAIKPTPVEDAPTEKPTTQPIAFEPPKNQKKAVVPDLEEIPNPFAFNPPVAKDVSAIPAPNPAPSPVSEPPVEPMPQAKPARPQPDAGESDSKPKELEMPTIRFEASANDVYRRHPFAPKTQPSQAPSGPATPATPATPAAKAPAPVPATAKPVAAPVPAPAPKPAAPAPAATATALKDENFLSMPIAQISEGWPQPVLDEIRQYNLENASVALPYGEVDMAMRKGKVAFSWAQVRGWMAQAAGVPSATATDDEEVIIPLKLVAPLFLARRQPRKPQKKVSIEEDIPDLFSGGETEPPAKPAATIAKAAPAPAPVDEPAPAVHPPVPATAGTAKVKAAEAPDALLHQACGFPGVDGALLAMHDGLVVAAELPDGLHGETVAAFLPQIFGRLTQFTTELKLGELSSVMLVIENRPWIIFRTRKVYFAVIGKEAEALPLPQLTAIVADINRRNL